MTDASAAADDATGPGTTAGAAPARPATPLWLAVTIAVFFGVFYAYDVWEAVRDLVGMTLIVGDLGVSFAGIGIALLIVALIVPLVVFALAFWLGRKRGPLEQVVLFLVGYALVQAISLGLASFFGLGGIDFS